MTFAIKINTVSTVPTLGASYPDKTGEGDFWQLGNNGSLTSSRGNVLSESLPSGGTIVYEDDYVSINVEREQQLISTITDEVNKTSIYMTSFRSDLDDSLGGTFIQICGFGNPATWIELGNQTVFANTPDDVFPETVGDSTKWGVLAQLLTPTSSSYAYVDSNGVLSTVTGIVRTQAGGEPLAIGKANSSTVADANSTHIAGLKYVSSNNLTLDDATGLAIAEYNRLKSIGLI